MTTQDPMTHKESESRRSPSGKTVYEAVLLEGEEELRRPSKALFWSGIAGGLAMGFSLITETLLTDHLPHASWTPLVAKLGYSIGFLVVILGRQQLFTENTLTPILPLLKHPRWTTFADVVRLWVIVLFANLIGALAVAWAIVSFRLFEPSTRETLLAISEESMHLPFWTVFLRAVFAGWIIALIVWLLPYAESARVLIIIILTYVIGLGHFAHIIAGSVKVFALGIAGRESWGHILLDFLLPTLIGNASGGVLLVASLNHAQVASGQSASSSSNV